MKLLAAVTHIEMNTNIKATNIELNNSVSEYVAKKLAIIQRYFSPELEVKAHVEVGKTTDHHKKGDEVYHAEFNIDAAGANYFSQSNSADLYAAIDLAKDEAVRQITEHSDKNRSLTRRGARMFKDMLRGLGFKS